MTETTTTIIQIGPIRLVRIETKTLLGPGLAKCRPVITVEGKAVGG